MIGNENNNELQPNLLLLLSSGLLVVWGMLYRLTLCVCVSLSHAECYSEASDHEEAESTEIPPPPYSEQTLRDSVDASGPPGSTHQVSHVTTLQESYAYSGQKVLKNFIELNPFRFLLQC